MQQLSRNMKIGIGVAVAAAVLGYAFIGRASAADLGRGKPAVQHDDGEPAAKAWTGIYLGANVGYGIVIVDAPVGPYNLSQSDWLFGVSAGADGQIGKHWVIGVFGDYDVAKSADNLDEGAWTLGVRAGYLLNPGMLVYGLGGYSKAVKGDADGAMVLGGGLEARLVGGWSTKLEYRHTFVNEALGPFDADSHQVRLGLAYKF